MLSMCVIFSKSFDKNGPQKAPKTNKQTCKTTIIKMYQGTFFIIIIINKTQNAVIVIFVNALYPNRN